MSKRIRPIFYGHVKNGKLEIYDKQKFRMWLRELNEKEVEIRVNKYKDKRTNSQNRYYWGVVLEILSDYTGHEPEELHEVLKEIMLPKKEVKFKLSDGKEVIRKISISTAELSTGAFETYLQKIREWAQKRLNCFIPLPNEFEPEPITYY